MKHMHCSSIFATAFLIIGLSCPPALAEGRTERIHVVERATNDTTAHVGQKDDNSGDILTFINDVYDADNVAKVGSDEGFCIRVASARYIIACGPHPSQRARLLYRDRSWTAVTPCWR